MFLVDFNLAKQRIRVRAKTIVGTMGLDHVDFAPRRIDDGALRLRKTRLATLVVREVSKSRRWRAQAVRPVIEA